MERICKYGCGFEETAKSLGGILNHFFGDDRIIYCSFMGKEWSRGRDCPYNPTCGKPKSSARE
jgi:hypothetical protein